MNALRPYLRQHSYPLTGITVRKGGAAFGKLCELLAQSGVQFTLAGHKTIIMTDRALEYLPDKAVLPLNKLEKDRAIVFYDASAAGRRRLPTKGEAEKALKKLVESKKPY